MVTDSFLNYNQYVQQLVLVDVSYLLVTRVAVQVLFKSQHDFRRDRSEIISYATISNEENFKNNGP